MTYTYTVELNEKQKRALEYAVYDINEWIVNAAQVRSRVATSEIVEIVTEYCNKNEIAIPVGELAQVEKAYELEIRKREEASERYSEAVKKIEEKYEQDKWNITRSKKESVKKMVQKAKNSPDEIDRILEQELGIQKG